MEKRIQSAHGPRPSARALVRGMDLKDKVAIVTGGASGIGRETTRALASAGATVIVGARNAAATKEAVALLRKDTGNDRIAAISLDLASLRSVRSFAREFLGVQGKLHMLINNAGIMACPQAYTEDGFESQIGTCHFGHFLLAQELMPALRAAAPSRVVSLSSVGHRRAPVNFEDMHFRSRPYDPWEAYGQAKSANALFAVGLTAHHRRDGVTANAVMPGGIMTGLQKHMTDEQKRALGWIDEKGVPNPAFKTPEEGAATSVWAAVGPELEGIGGLYLEDCAEAGPWTPENPNRGVREYALDPTQAERLWALSLEAVQG